MKLAPLHTPLLALLLTGCAPEQKRSTEPPVQKGLQRYERYILEWKGRKELPADHHFLFLGVGVGCPGCSYLFIEKGEEAILDQDSLSIVIHLRRRRRPDALSWVEKAENARFDTSSDFMSSSKGLPFPIYLHTDSTGAIATHKGLKKERDTVSEALGW